MTVAERTDEMTPELREALRAHRGKWVALTTDPAAILAAEDSPAEAYEAARRAGVETPLIYKVPDSTLSSYYY